MGKIDQRRKPRRAPAQPAAVRPVIQAKSVWRRHGWHLLALLVLVAAAYSNSFHAGLIFDNAGLIAHDPRIRDVSRQNIQAIWRGGYWYIDSTSGLYRPLTTFSYLLNYAVLGNGMHPVGYHSINLALHEVNIALVYALGILIFGQPMPALALAAIWGLHPLLTESVTNIVGRADLLAAFGVLAGLICHIKAASLTVRRKATWLAGLIGAQTIGLFSKESAVVLPGIMLLYDLTWRERATWRGRASAYAAIVLPFAAFFYMRGGFETHMLVQFTENPLVSAGFWTARLTAIKVIGKFLWLFLWPAQLSADYSYSAIPLFGWRAGNWEDVKTLLALAICLAAVLLVVLLVIRWRSTDKPLLFFLIFFFITLAPTSNLIVIIGSIMAERFLYLPSIGLAGCGIAAIHALIQRRSPQWRLSPQLAGVALGVACLSFAARTYARNFDWTDEVSLWTSAAKACPASARPHYNLATALARIPGRGQDAIAEFEAALRIRPPYAEAHYNLGNALAQLPGRQQDAIAEYKAALRTKPDLAEAHYSLGNALGRIPGRQQDAITEYKAALRIRPDYADAHNNLGTTLARTPGELPDAIAEFQAALRIRPDYADAHNNLGIALAHVPGRLPEAIAEYEMALRIQPDHANAHRNLGEALEQIPGRLHEAIAEYKAALRTEPDFAEAHYNLAAALEQIPGRLPEAITEYEAFLRLRPDPHVRQMLDRLRAHRR